MPFLRHPPLFPPPLSLSVSSFYFVSSFTRNSFEPKKAYFMITQYIVGMKEAFTINACIISFNESIYDSDELFCLYTIPNIREQEKWWATQMKKKMEQQ